MSMLSCTSLIVVGIFAIIGNIALYILNNKAEKMLTRRKQNNRQ